MKKVSIVNSELQGIFSELKSLPEKSPLSLDIANVIVSIQDMAKKYLSEREKIMNDFLLVDDEGNFVLTKEAKEKIEAAKKESNQNFVANEFGYEIDGSENDRKQYIERIIGLNCKKQTMNSNPIDVESKSILVSGTKMLLKDCIADYFTFNQIVLLKNVGIIKS